jgi:hypothetical protein
MLDLSGATPRQREFITDLLAKRVYVVATDFAVPTPAAASALIGALLAAPHKPLAIAAVPRVDAELLAALASAPVSKYAIPVVELFPELLDVRPHGDLLFVEVKDFRGRRSLNRLTGAPGWFSRTRMSRNDTLILMNLLSADAYKYTRLFGEHYRCCGKCGAELTDAESRRLMLGPVCRKAFGL